MKKLDDATYEAIIDLLAGAYNKYRAASGEDITFGDWLDLVWEERG